MSQGSQYSNSSEPPASPTTPAQGDLLNVALPYYMLSETGTPEVSLFRLTRHGLCAFWCARSPSWDILRTRATLNADDPVSIPSIPSSRKRLVDQLYSHCNQANNQLIRSIRDEIAEKRTLPKTAFVDKVLSADTPPTYNHGVLRLCVLDRLVWQGQECVSPEED